MKINELSNLNLNEVFFKLSDRSITVKGENNKTKAVINDIQKLSSLPGNKKFEIHSIYKDVSLNKYSNEIYVDHDKNLYYIGSQRHHETVVKLFNNGFEDDLKRLNAKIKELTSLKVNVLFLNLI